MNAIRDMTPDVPGDEEEWENYWKQVRDEQKRHSKEIEQVITEADRAFEPIEDAKEYVKDAKINKRKSKNIMTCAQTLEAITDITSGEYAECLKKCDDEFEEASKELTAFQNYESCRDNCGKARMRAYKKIKK